MNDPALVIAIPAYNAALTLESVLDRIPQEISERAAHYIVVNDGSTDATADVARRLRKRFPKLELIEHPVNRGYEGADIAREPHLWFTARGVSQRVHAVSARGAAGHPLPVFP